MEWWAPCALPSPAGPAEQARLEELRAVVGGGVAQEEGGGGGLGAQQREARVDAAACALLGALMRLRPAAAPAGAVPRATYAPDAYATRVRAAAISRTERWQWAWLAEDGDDGTAGGAADSQATQPLSDLADEERPAAPRPTAELLVGTLHPSASTAPGESPIGAAWLQLASGGAIACALEQPRPELRGALVWVAAWSVVYQPGSEPHDSLAARGADDTADAEGFAYLELCVSPSKHTIPPRWKRPERRLLRAGGAGGAAAGGRARPAQPSAGRPERRGPRGGRAAAPPPTPRQAAAAALHRHRAARLPVRVLARVAGPHGSRGKASRLLRPALRPTTEPRPVEYE